MAKTKEKEKAISLRKQGKSFSEIQSKIPVSKSTLSRWLKDMPLTKEQLVKLRDKNPVRIEKYRNTMLKKRMKRLDLVSERAREDIGEMTNREIFIAGLFLYWAEGTKTDNYTTSVSNTDPAVLKFFISWLQQMGVPKQKLRLRLHLYQDMNKQEITKFWSKTLSIPLNQFRKPYVKKVNHDKKIQNKGRFGYGTCNVIFGNRDIKEYINMCLRLFQETYK